MAAKNTIKLNPTKSSSIDFDVTISGLEKVIPAVRFVIENVKDGIDWVVKCKKLDTNKWQATFPAFGVSVPESVKFSVEVIVDEYYFKPAQGTIQFINTPDISFESTSKNKPTVTTSFSVKQDNEPKEIKEASGGPEVTGQYAPTNGLLKKEEDPTLTQGHVKTAQAEVYDQFIDDARLDDITDEEPIPGEGEQYPQDDGKEDEFDSRKIAENIVKTLGFSHQGTSEKKGSLFKRDANGKIIVPGLENPDQKRQMLERERKIKDLLRP